MWKSEQPQGIPSLQGSAFPGSAPPLASHHACRHVSNKCEPLAVLRFSAGAVPARASKRWVLCSPPIHAWAQASGLTSLAFLLHLILWGNSTEKQEGVSIKDAHVP